MVGKYGQLNKIRNSIIKHQNSSMKFHPLTCGDNSNHEKLFPQLELKSEKEDLFELTLCCKDCGFTQDVPFFFTNEVILDDGF